MIVDTRTVLCHLLEQVQDVLGRVPGSWSIANACRRARSVLVPHSVHSGYTVDYPNDWRTGVPTVREVVRRVRDVRPYEECDCVLLAGLLDQIDENLEVYEAAGRLVLGEL